METNRMISINGTTAEVEFGRFDLEAYQLFLRAKRLPESQVTYDWERDTYRLTTPARFAAMLGADLTAVPSISLDIAPFLFDYQRFITRTALDSRRYAIYADCGLGKTLIFLEWGRHVIAATGGRVLVFSPPQVIEQTREEAARFYGDSLPMKRIESRGALAEWCKRPGAGMGITNYEKLIDGVLPELRYLTGLVCDESSILKSGGGVIKWNLIKSSKGIAYKLSCTATPAPNDIMEYASQAAFLEKLRTEGEILWTFFTRDKKGNWRIKPHAREGFYRFMASWSIYLRNPAHYGWADNLSNIPEPEFHEYRIAPTDEQMRAAGETLQGAGAGLLADRSLGVVQRTKLSQIAKGFVYVGKRADRMPSRKPEFVADLIRSEVSAGHQVLVWTVFDEEGRLIAEHLAGVNYAVLDGGVKEKARLPILEAFRRGELPALISKASMLGFGMNFQCCSSMIFSGWDDSYERFYQAVRRAYRYGQTRSVRVHLPFVPELEGVILENVLRKKGNFEADAEEQERYYKLALEGIAA
jgi:hypothetical protein